MKSPCVWPAPAATVTVVLDGRRETYASLAEAIRRHCWAISLSQNGEGLAYSRGAFCPILPVRFLDPAGLDIPPRAVAAAAEEACSAFRIARLGRFGRIRYDPASFRNGPVPGTGRRGGGSWFRHMRTTQERRAAKALAHDEDCVEAGVKARARRNFANLVSAWDDVMRGGDSRSWKRNRRTQWKERGER